MGCTTVPGPVGFVSKASRAIPAFLCYTSAQRRQRTARARPSTPFCAMFVVAVVRALPLARFCKCFAAAGGTMMKDPWLVVCTCQKRQGEQHPLRLVALDTLAALALQQPRHPVSAAATPPISPHAGVRCYPHQHCTKELLHQTHTLAQDGLRAFLLPPSCDETRAKDGERMLLGTTDHSSSRQRDSRQLCPANQRWSMSDKHRPAKLPPWGYADSWPRGTACATNLQQQLLVRR